MEIANSQIKSLSSSQAQSAPANTPKLQQHKADQTAGEVDLGTWYTQAWSYYNDVMNGVQPMPDQASWGEFMAQLEWAKGQLFGSAGAGAWDPSAAGMDPNMAGPEQAPAPEGAYTGPTGDHVFDLKESHIFFDGDMTTAQVFSTDNTLDIPSMGAKVDMAVVNDQETGGTEVLKVTLTYVDGRTKTIIYDNYSHEDFSLAINAANMDNVTIPDTVSDKVSLDEFDGNADPASAEVTLDGVPVEPTEEKVGEFVAGDRYEADNVNQIFQFNPTADGEGSTNFVVGNSEITVPLSSTVEVEARPGANFEGSNSFQYDYLITVKHSDGTVDQYYVKDDFDVRINAVPENVGFRDVETYDLISGEIPEGYEEVFNINGEVSSEAESGAFNPDHPEDTQPVHEEFPESIAGSNPDTMVTVYDSPTVNLHPHYDEDTPGWIEVYAQDLNLTFDSMRDEVTVWSNNGYYQIYIQFADGGNKTIVVDKDTIQHININGGQINLDGMDIEADEVINVPGVTDVEPEEVELSASEQDSMAIAEELAGINGINMTAQEIFDAAQDQGLNLASFNDPLDPDLFDFLISIDPKLEDLIQDYRNYDGDTDGDIKGSRLRNHLVELWSVIFPDDDFEVDSASGSKHTDNIIYNGQTYDIFDQDKRKDSQYDWITFKND